MKRKKLPEGAHWPKEKYFVLEDIDGKMRLVDSTQVFSKQNQMPRTLAELKRLNF